MRRFPCWFEATRHTNIYLSARRLRLWMFVAFRVFFFESLPRALQRQHARTGSPLWLFLSPLLFHLCREWAQQNPLHKLAFSNVERFPAVRLPIFCTPKNKTWTHLGNCFVSKHASATRILFPRSPAAPRARFSLSSGNISLLLRAARLRGRLHSSHINWSVITTWV
jgi:hypothetical protein